MREKLYNTYLPCNLTLNQVAKILTLIGLEDFKESAPNPFSEILSIFNKLILLLHKVAIQ